MNTLVDRNSFDNYKEWLPFSDGGHSVMMSDGNRFIGLAKLIIDNVCIRGAVKVKRKYSGQF
jgi:hypothetical protein